MRRFFYAMLLCSFFIFPATADNLVYRFGPKSNTLIVFTAPIRNGDNNSSAAVSALKKLAQTFDASPPHVSVMIALTHNDYSILPVGIPVKRFEGTKKLIETISAYSNPVVCVCDTGNSETAQIIAGVKGLTSPPWLLGSVYNTLVEAGIPIDFSPRTQIFHRIGWTASDPVLQLYADANIPFIKIETNRDISGFLRRLPQILHTHFSKEWDVHYLVRTVHNKLIIIKEKTIVRIILLTAMAILFWLMLFSFLFGKKTQEHLKDFLVLWWIPFYFFVVNYISFFLSGYITEFVFLLRFGSITPMSRHPLLALILKYLFTLLGIVVATVFNIKMRLPRNKVIYGFIASAVCLINIFIFSAFNFSFSIAFILIYFISLAAYQCNHIILQVIFLFLLFLPLQPFGMHIFNYSSVLFQNIFFRNIEPALIFIPFDLLLVRFFLSIDTSRYRKKKLLAVFQLPIIIFSVTVFLMQIMPIPASYSQDEYMLMQKIKNDTAAFFKRHITDDKKTIALSDTVVRQTKAVLPYADSCITVNTELNNYFERSIGTITIDSPLRIESFAITLKPKDGTTFFEADQPFEKHGTDTVFVSESSPSLPFSVHFSSTKQAEFDVDVTIWSTENPCGIVFVKPEKNDATLPFLLEVSKSFSLKVK